MSKRCGAKTQNTGEPCKSWPMKGKTRCRKHGGKGAGRPPIHGLYSVKHRESLEAKMKEYLADPRPLRLLDELAMQRALFADFLDKITDAPISLKSREHAFMLLESIGKTVERIDRIRNRTALTVAEVMYLRAMIIDVIQQFLPPEDSVRFMHALQARIRGRDHDTEILSLEDGQDD